MTRPGIPSIASSIFISHGGGPLPVLGDPGHREMVAHLREIASMTRKPSAIVVVSAHWEEPVATVTSGTHPPLIYDYYGFPPESYKLEYPARGHPELAAEIAARLKQKGVPSRLSVDRGFDHGLFVPLLLMYPEADIPCVQLSLLSSLDPAEHLRMGEAISSLPADVLVLGSGFSFHNLRVLLGRGAAMDPKQNAVFEDWLIETCTNSMISESERKSRLVHWSEAPAARYCQPREEHLLPLHVCYGKAGQAAAAHAELTIMGAKSSTYFW